MLENITNKIKEVSTNLKQEIKSLDIKQKLTAGALIVASAVYGTLVTPETPIVDQPTISEVRTLPENEVEPNRQLPTNEIEQKIEPVVPELKPFSGAPPVTQIPETKTEFKPIIIGAPPEETIKTKVIEKIKKVFTKKPRPGENYDDEGTLTYNNEKAQRYTEWQQEMWSSNFIRPEGVNALFGRRKLSY